MLVAALVALAASPAVAAAPSSAKPAAPAAKAPPGYGGHGVETVSPEVLKRFQAPPVDAALARRVQALLDVRAPSPGVVSPDGKRLYFTWTVTGTSQVWRLDGPKAFPIQLTGGQDATSIVGVTDDGKTLVLQRDRAGEENPGLYRMSVDGGPLEVIQHKPKVQSQAQVFADDGKALYFRANDQQTDAYAIYRHDLSSKQTTTVFAQPGLWLLADQRGERLLLMKEIGSNQAEVFEYNTATQALTPLLGQGEREDYVVAYGANGKDGAPDVLVLTPKLGEFRRLYRFDRASKQLTPFSPEMKWDVEDFQVDGSQKRVLVSVNEGGYARPRAFDAKSGQELTLPRVPMADNIVFSKTTKNARFTTMWVDPGVRPGESYVLDWQRKKLEPWHVPSAPEVDLSTFAATKLESYPARDGTLIPMFVRRPVRCAAADLSAPCPVIVDFHGGPESQTRAGFNVRAQLFVDAGFVYVQPNVRGSDGYGKTWIHADDGAKRKAILTDIQDAGLYLRDAWKVKGIAPKLGVYGGSYGGYSVLVAMTMFAGTFDAGVEVVGISNLVTFLENTAPYRRILRASEYGDPVKDRDMLLSISPTTHVDKVKGPLLLIQGATDPRVPVGEAVQMFEALEKKKTGAQLIIFPDEGHGVRKRENQVLYLGHSLAFFEQHLMGKKSGS